ERALHRELRLAVVVAAGARSRALAGDAVPPLQQWRLRGVELEVEREGRGVAGDVRAVAARVRCAAAREAPVAQGHLGLARPRRGDAEAAARDALVVAQPPAREVGDCGMGEQQLARRETA